MFNPTGAAMHTLLGANQATLNANDLQRAYSEAQQAHLGGYPGCSPMSAAQPDAERFRAYVPTPNFTSQPTDVPTDLLLLLEDF